MYNKIQITLSPSFMTELLNQQPESSLKEPITYTPDQALARSLLQIYISDDLEISETSLAGFSEK